MISEQGKDFAADRKAVYDLVISESLKIFNTFGPFDYSFYFCFINDGEIYTQNNGKQSVGRWEAKPDHRINIYALPARTVTRPMAGLNRDNFNPQVTFSVEKKGEKAFDTGIALSKRIKTAMEPIATVQKPATRFNLYLFVDYDKDRLYKKMSEKGITQGHLVILNYKKWFIIKKTAYLFLNMEIGNK